MPKIAVVLAVHNRIDLTRKFLKSLFAQNFDGYKVVLVDDGSSDGTSDMVANEFPQVHLIVGDGTLWWTKSTNLAIETALHQYQPEFICTVNDDTELDPNFLTGLYEAAKKIPRAIVGGFAYNISNRSELLYDGSIVNWITGKITVLNSFQNHRRRSELLCLTYYIGRGILIPAAVFTEVGYYNAKAFPQSWADNELVFRAKRKGYQVYSTPTAIQYIHADESKHLKLRKKKSLGNYFKYLFIQQGGGNIIAYSKYVIASYPWYGIPSSLVRGIASRISGYWLH